MRFEFFKQFIVKSEEQRLKHTFYSVENEQLIEMQREVDIPIELNDFYLEVGYGFMFDNPHSYSINKVLSPTDFMKINLRLDYYEFDPTLELFKDPIFNNKQIFFEINEGVYLLIAREANDGKNAIYYFDEKIADSLEEFLIRFDREGHYFEHQ